MRKLKSALNGESFFNFFCRLAACESGKWSVESGIMDEISFCAKARLPPFPSAARRERERDCAKACLMRDEGFLRARKAHERERRAGLFFSKNPHSVLALLVRNQAPFPRTTSVTAFPSRPKGVRRGANREVPHTPIPALGGNRAPFPPSVTLFLRKGCQFRSECRVGVLRRCDTAICPKGTTSFARRATSFMQSITSFCYLQTSLRRRCAPNNRRSLESLGMTKEMITATQGKHSLSNRHSERSATELKNRRLFGAILNSTLHFPLSRSAIPHSTLASAFRIRYASPLKKDPPIGGSFFYFLSATETLGFEL